MTLRANAPPAPAPCDPAPIVPVSLPSAVVLAEPAPPPPEPGICVPALGGSTVVAFLGQPASNAAAAHKQPIDSIFVIDLPMRIPPPVSTLDSSVPSKTLIVYRVWRRCAQNGDHAGSCTSPSLATNRSCTRPSALTSAKTPRPRSRLAEMIMGPFGAELGL